MKRAKDLAKALKEFGIRAIKDKGMFPGNGNSDDEIFLMGIDRAAGIRDTLYFTNDKKVKVSIAGDKKLRQAVLKVTEDERVVKVAGKIRANRHRYDENSAESYDSLSKRAAQSRAKITHKMKNSWDIASVARQFGVSVPSEDVSARNYKVVRRVGLGKESIIYDISFDMVVPATEMHLLVGYDEKEAFISQLPEKATTVNRAHTVLKPKNWKKSWLRQGEFFFRPLTEKEIRILIEDIEDNSYGSADEIKTCRLLEDGDYNETDHDASLYYNMNNDIMVCGSIRNDRHKELFLPNWHEVIVNREIPAPDGVDYD